MDVELFPWIGKLSETTLLVEPFNFLHHIKPFLIPPLASDCLFFCILKRSASRQRSVNCFDRK